MTPWVSILTPVYNGIEFLEECAMSVCLQMTSHHSTSFTWEWIIGINGHGDGGSVLAEAMRIKQKCMIDTITVVNLPGVEGKVGALNAMTAVAKGDWIAVLDCDDTWERTKLIAQRLAIERAPQPIDVIGTFCRYFGDIVSDGPLLPSGWIPPESFRRSNPIINSSVLIARRLAHWEDRFGLEDYDLWLRLQKEGARFFNVPLHLVNHRIHMASAFNGKGKQDLEGLLHYHLKS